MDSCVTWRIIHYTKLQNTQYVNFLTHDKWWVAYSSRFYRVLYSCVIEYYTKVPLSTILKCHWVLYSFCQVHTSVVSWFCLTLFGDINCNNWQVLTKCPKRLDSFVEATLKSLTILAAGHAEPRLVVWQGCAPLDGVLILMSRLPA